MEVSPKERVVKPGMNESVDFADIPSASDSIFRSTAKATIGTEPRISFHSMSTSPGPAYAYNTNLGFASNPRYTMQGKYK